MTKETEKKHEGFATTKGKKFLKKVFGNKKKKSSNEEGGQREREHQEGTYKGVETWKESTDRIRNEKHKYKNEDDQNGNLSREIFC